MRSFCFERVKGRGTHDTLVDTTVPLSWQHCFAKDNVSDVRLIHREKYRTTLIFPRRTTSRSPGGLVSVDLKVSKTRAAKLIECLAPRTRGFSSALTEQVLQVAHCSRTDSLEHSY